MLPRRQRLGSIWQLIKSYSHVSVLERGFALVTGPDGHPLRTTSAVLPGMDLTIRLADGTFSATAEGEAGPKPKPAKPPRKAREGQGSLF